MIDYHGDMTRQEADQSSRANHAQPSLDMHHVRMHRWETPRQVRNPAKTGKFDTCSDPCL